MTALQQLRETLARLRATTTPHIHRREQAAGDWSRVEQLLAALDTDDDQGDDDDGPDLGGTWPRF